MFLKRLFDIVLAVFLALILVIPCAIIGMMIKLSSNGPVFYKSERVGIDNRIFKMYKFRTMKTNTPALATHLLEGPENYLTAIGYFLRKMSFDEIPQLINIIKGDMSFVGPRPALFNQDDLIELRTEKGIHKIAPGLTGWAQINGRDNIPIPVKVEFDHFYMMHRSFSFDIKILLLTLLKVIKKEGVSH
jgi:O-antigen biosynthesis protein WbqP